MQHQRKGENIPSPFNFGWNRVRGDSAGGSLGRFRLRRATLGRSSNSPPPKSALTDIVRLALNDPQTELVILGLSENAAVTTCGWARHFFDSGGSSGF